MVLDSLSHRGGNVQSDLKVGRDPDYLMDSKEELPPALANC